MKKNEYAEQYIRKKIISLGLSAKLPSVAILIDEMNQKLQAKPMGGLTRLSAQPVREALNNLAREGLIELARGRAATVTSTVSIQTKGLKKSGEEHGYNVNVIDLRPIREISVNHDEVSAYAGECLGLTAHDHLLCIDRLRQLNENQSPENLRWDRTYMPAAMEITVQLKNFSAEDSLLDNQKIAGFKPLSREINVSGRLTTKAEQHRFNAEGPIPVLAIEQLTVGMLKKKNAKSEAVRYEFLIAVCGSAWNLTYHRAN